MNICLLIITFSNLSPDKNIVRFKLLIFEYTLFCAPNNYSEFILIPRWRGYFYNWLDKPFFLLYQINPCLESTLGTYTELRVKISQFNRFSIKEMPLFHKISIFNVNLSKANHSIFS